MLVLLPFHLMVHILYNSLSCFKTVFEQHEISIGVSWLNRSINRDNSGSWFILCWSNYGTTNRRSIKGKTWCSIPSINHRSWVTTTGWEVCWEKTESESGRRPSEQPTKWGRSASDRLAYTNGRNSLSRSRQGLNKESCDSRDRNTLTAADWKWARMPWCVKTKMSLWESVWPGDFFSTPRSWYRLGEEALYRGRSHALWKTILEKNPWFGRGKRTSDTEHR